jgi:hypothetical protein
MSLLDYGAVSSSGQTLPDGHPFTGFTGFYWTSTTFALDPGDEDFVSDAIYPCTPLGYGDNRYRFNDAYIVSFRTGELIHAPKGITLGISTRHARLSNRCSGQGFRSGGPAESPRFMPKPRFIAVRDPREAP